MANTPRKIYCRQNICILCGFSFVQTKLQADGTESEVKFFKLKLRLNTERLEAIQNILGIESESWNEINNYNNGVCKKCYAQVEKVSKLQNDIKMLIDKLQSSRASVKMMTLTLPSPAKRTFTKRMAKSPVRPPTTKQLKSFPTVVKRSPIKLLTMNEVLAQRVAIMPKPTLDVAETARLTTIHQKEEVGKPIVRQPIIRRTLFQSAISGDDTGTLGVLEQELSKDGELATELTDKDETDDPDEPSFKIPWPKKIPSSIEPEDEGSRVKKTARRSIRFQPYEKSPDIERPDGEVEVTIFYSSGTKKRIVEEEGQIKACRAIVRGSDFDRVVLDHISVVKPMDVIRSSSKVVAEECRILCKKNSQSLLQKKTHDDIMNFKWEKFYNELKSRCPGLCSILSAIVSDVPIQATGKAFQHMLMTAAIGLHGRSQNMSALQYISGFLLTHGGCTQKDIQRLSQIGFTTHPVTLHQKLLSWENELSAEIKHLRNEWAAGGQKKYQLIGDNWDKNILPSYRTSDRKTLSLHLFNMYAIIDRICPEPSTSYTKVTDVADLDCLTFIPSKEEQALLLKEMTFLFSTSIIANHPELNKKFKQIYPQHLPHKYSHQAGLKTSQYPLGLYDCNENKTQDVIKLLTDLTEEFVPFSDGEIVESVFLGGDRLTDERVQCAQQSVGNGLTPKDRLEGFISKIEDFHRLMNFLEAIHKMTYNTQSGKEKGTVYFFRNLLNTWRNPI